MLGFTIKSLALGIAFAALVVLVEMALDSVVAAAAGASMPKPLHAGFIAAAIAVLVAFVLCPVWLLVLRKRDEKNEDTSGFALSVMAMVIACLVFCFAVGQLANVMGILGVFA